MKEVKTPKKPLYFYYIIALCILMAINFLALPNMLESRIKEVDYGTFMSMTENKEIDKVEIQDNKIVFTAKNDKSTVYETGIINDLGLVDRLHSAGAEFSSEIVRQTSPIVSFLIS